MSETKTSGQMLYCGRALADYSKAELIEIIETTELQRRADFEERTAQYERLRAWREARDLRA